MDVDAHDVHVSIDNSEGPKGDSANSDSGTTIINNYNNVFNVFNGAATENSSFYHLTVSFVSTGCCNKTKADEDEDEKQPSEPATLDLSKCKILSQ